MCNSQSSACCPAPQVFQEKICGNFNILPGTPDQNFWTANSGTDFLAGTFEVFNSTSSPINANVGVASSPATPLTPVSPGDSISVSVSRPTTFGISGVTGVSGLNGTYCITLYKRVMA